MLYSRPKETPMLRLIVLATVSAFVLLLVMSPVWAHHAPSAIFDMGKRISVTGTLTKIDWINPHIVIAMEAKDNGGKVDRWTEDPAVLAAPWVMPPRLIKPSKDVLEESPKCVETDGAKLLNDDHHGQR